MKHKRLMALLLALTMMITFIPAMAFADDSKTDPLSKEQMEQNEDAENQNESLSEDLKGQDEGEKNPDNSLQDTEQKQKTSDVPEKALKTKENLLPAPTGLKWDRKTARWDSDVSSRENDFEVALLFSATGEKNSYSEVSGAVHYGFVGKDVTQKYYHFDVDITQSGYYKFTVTEVKEKDDESYEIISATAESDPIQIHKVTVVMFRSDDGDTYDWTGPVSKRVGNIETVEADYTFQDDALGADYFFVPDGATTTIYGRASYGKPYRCVGFSSYEREPGTPTIQGNQLTIVNVDSDKKYSAYFNKYGGEKITVEYDLGAEHVSVAKKIEEYLREEGSYSGIEYKGRTNSLLTLEMNDAETQWVIANNLSQLTFIANAGGFSPGELIVFDIIDNNKHFLDTGLKPIV